MSSSSTAQQPSPQLFFQTINAHQRTEALKAAIELEVFAVDEEALVGVVLDGADAEGGFVGVEDLAVL